MEKDVIISIKGRQDYPDAPPDTIELVTAGQLAWDEAGCTITYPESELTGLEGTLTTIRTEGDQVTLLRQGAVNAQMVFQEGKRHLSMYETPYGTMAVGVHTRRLSNDLTGQGGTLEIDYAIEIDHALAGRNTFHISVREPGGSHLRQ